MSHEGRLKTHSKLSKHFLKRGKVSAQRFIYTFIAGPVNVFDILEKKLLKGFYNKSKDTLYLMGTAQLLYQIIS